MKMTAFPTAKLLLLTQIAGAGIFQSAKAQQAIPSSSRQASGNAKQVLGQSCQKLLALYGKPVKIYSLADSLPDKLLLPSGVPLLSPESASVEERAVLPSLAGRQKNMIWLYKGKSGLVSYLIDRLGCTESACAAGSAIATAVNGQPFEIAPLRQGALGDDVRKVLFYHAYPDEIRRTSSSTHDLVYWPKEASSGHLPTFTTIFTVRNSRVVRLYSYEDYLHSRRPLWSAKPYLLTRKP